MRAQRAAALAMLAVVASLVVAVPADPVAAALCDDITVAAGGGGAGLNAAIEEANTCVGHQTITIEPGTYSYSRGHRITDTVTIRGSERADPPRLNGLGQTTRAFNVSGVTEPVVIEDVVVEGALRAGLLSVVSADVTLRRVSYLGISPTCGVGTVDGIHAQASTLLLEDIAIDTAGCSGVSAFDGSTVTIERSTITGSAQRGVWITGDLTVVDSTLADNGTNGIETAGATTTVDVTGSRFPGNGASGIRQGDGTLIVRSSTFGLAADGSAAGNAEAGIWASFASVLVDGAVSAHNATGVQASNNSPITITGSTIRDNAGAGLALSRNTVAVATTAFTANNPNCTFFLAAIQDDGGNTDDDDTCGVVTNQPPAVVDDRFEVDEDTLLSVAAPGVLGNDSDPDGGALTATVETGPLHAATFSLESDGSFRYEPAPNFFGDDSFTYSATDPGGLRATAAVEISVAGANDAPTIDAPPGVVTDVLQPAIFVATVADAETTADALVVDAEADPLLGSVEATAPDAAGNVEVTFRPRLSTVGDVPVTLTVDDGQAQTSAEVVVEVGPPLGPLFEIEPLSVIEGDPDALTVAEAGERPFLLGVRVALDEDLDVDIRVRGATSPTAPEAPIVGPDCSLFVDVATAPEFSLTIGQGGPPVELPIVVCDDQRAERDGILEIEILDPLTRDVVFTEDLLLRDDDLVTLEAGPATLLEGGVMLEPPLPFLISESTVHSFVYDVPPWVTDATFLLRRGDGEVLSPASAVPACDPLGPASRDVLMGPWSANTGYIVTCGDATPSVNEPLELLITTPSGPETIPLLLRDDDVPPTFLASPVSVDEPTSSEAPKQISVVVPLEAALGYPYQAQATTVATAGDAVPAPVDCAGDFVPITEMVTIPADATEVLLGVTICPNGLGDPDGDFELVLSAPTTEIEPSNRLATIPVTIVDSGELPALSGVGSEGIEGSGLAATFTFAEPIGEDTTLYAATRVEGDQPVASPVPIPCTGDFVPLLAVATPIALTAGATSFSVDVTTCDDAEVESTEDLFVDVVDRPVGGSVVATAELVILDDPPVVEILGPIEIVEGTSGPVAPLVGPPIVLELTSTAALPVFVGIGPVDGDQPLRAPACTNEFEDLVQEVFTPFLVPGPQSIPVGFVCADTRIEPDEPFRVEIISDVAGNETLVLAERVITIVDDDTPSTLLGVDVEVLESAGTVDVEFAIDEVGLAPRSVWARTQDGTATAGTDYGPLLGTALPLNVPGGSTEPIPVPVSIVDDGTDEPSESFVVGLYDAPLGGELVAQAAVTIVDDDALPVVVVADREVTEGTEIVGVGGVGLPARLPVTMSLSFVEVPGSSVSVGVRTVGGTGDPGDRVADETVCLLPGQDGGNGFQLFPTLDADFVEFRVDVCADDRPEPDETLVMELFVAAGAQAGAVLDTFTVTILDDDTPTLRGVDIEVPEEDGEADVQFLVDEAGAGTLWVVARTTDGTATAEDDYEPLLGNPPPIPILAGSVTPIVIPVALLDDVQPEGDEDFTLGLYDDFDGRLIAEATVTIIDTDRAYPLLAAPPPIVVVEDHVPDPAFFNIVEPAADFVDLLIGIRSVGGAVIGDCGGGADIRDTSRILSLPPTQGGGIGLALDPCSDRALEDDVTVEVYVAGVAGGPELASVEVRIVDDDEPPVLDLLDTQVAEGDTGFGDPVTLSLFVAEAPERSYDVVVELTGAGNAAIGDCDPDFGPPDDFFYVPQFGSTGTPLTIEPNQAGETINFDFGRVCADLIEEPNVWLDVRVVDGPEESGGVSDAGRLTIVDNDETILLNALDAAIVEGDDGERTLEVDVEVVGAPQTPLDIAWTTRPVEAPGLREATAGSDYLSSEGTVDPTLGSENRTIEIKVLGDTRPEGDEWFELVITSQNATVVGGVALLRIVDDDRVGVNIDDAGEVLEGDAEDSASLAFDVSIDGEIDTPVVVGWATHDRSGIVPSRTGLLADGDGPDRDFDGDAGIVTFVPGGPTSLTVPVVVRGDDITEVHEEVFVHLVSIDGPGRLDDSEGRGRIRDDDEIVFVYGGPPIQVASGSGQPVTSAAPGATVLIQGSGFAPATTAIIEIRSTPIELAVVDTTAAGTIEVEITIPADFATGEHTIVVIARDNAGRVSETLYPLTIVDLAECTITGTDGRDVLFGTRGDDVLCGLGGNDILIGLGGDDLLIGGAGRDTLLGGSGHDVLLGGADDDWILAGSGADIAEGGGGADRVFGGGGDDELDGGADDDRLWGQRGADVLFGAWGDDVLIGGAGTDQLDGGPGRDRLIAR